MFSLPWQLSLPLHPASPIKASGRGKDTIARACKVVIMSKSPASAPQATSPQAPTLQDLRREIDRIDEFDASPLDGARRDHRHPDQGQEDAGGRLGVPSGARSRHDAPPGRATPRHAAARHCREHLARHHLGVHLCAGAVFDACGFVGRRFGDARLRALPFRLLGAVRRAFLRRCRRRRARAGQGRSRTGAGDRQPHRMVDCARTQGRAKDQSRGCRSSSAPIIPPRCRCS